MPVSLSPSALNGKEDEDSAFRPCSPPQRSSAGDSAFYGGGGVTRGDAAAWRLLVRPLGGRKCSISDENRSSAPTLTGAGNDYETLSPAGGVEGAAVLVSTPPRLMRMRVAFDGSLIESNVRRLPVHRRKRRNQGRQQRHGGRLEGNRPWSKTRGRSLGVVASGTSSRRGCGTSGGGSNRGSDMFGKLKGMLSLEPKPRSPAVRPMSRLVRPHFLALRVYLCALNSSPC